MPYKPYQRDGYEHNEIAEMMGCSIGNSKSQLHKARMKLRELLATREEGDNDISRDEVLGVQQSLSSRTAAAC